MVLDDYAPMDSGVHRRFIVPDAHHRHTTATWACAHDHHRCRWAACSRAGARAREREMGSGNGSMLCADESASRDTSMAEDRDESAPTRRRSRVSG